MRFSLTLPERSPIFRGFVGNEPYILRCGGILASLRRLLRLLDFGVDLAVQ